MTQLQKFIASIRARFTRTSKLPRIIASFSKTVKDLRALAAQNDNKIARNNDRIVDLRAESDALDVESIRAERIASNIEKLVKG